MSLTPSGPKNAIDRATRQYQAGDRAAGSESLGDVVADTRDAAPEEKITTWQTIANLVHGNPADTSGMGTTLSGKGGGHGHGGGKGGWGGGKGGGK